VDTALIAGFVGAAVVAYAIPGPDWLMVMRGTTTSVRRGIETGLGSQTGLLVHGLLATIGVSAFIAAAPTALTVIQIAGALYLLYLGVSGMRHQVSDQSAVDSIGWRQALITNLANPKAIIFFAAIAPQFITPSAPVWSQMLVLTGIDVALGVVWWTVLAVVMAPVVTRVGTGRITAVASALLALVAAGLLAYTATDAL
jgi:threonine/homoserine/homoserine lactone efflux protein